MRFLRPATIGSRPDGRLRSAVAAPSGMPRTLRWDRISRLALLTVLVILLVLYISPIRSLVSAVHQSSQRHAQLAALEHTGAHLRALEHALKQPATLEIEARNLGLVRPGELGYIVSGLPNN